MAVTAEEFKECVEALKTTRNRVEELEGELKKAVQAQNETQRQSVVVENNFKEVSKELILL